MNSNKHTYALSDVINEFIPLFQNIENKFLEISILIRYITNISLEEYVAYSQKQETHYSISQREYQEIAKLVNKRIDGYPIAYLINNKDFYMDTFCVNENVLIPRVETEFLVEKAIELITETERLESENNSSGTNTIIDCGTGSGCIGISLGKFLIENNIKKNWHICLSDISINALQCARENCLDIFQIQDTQSLEVNQSPYYITPNISLSLAQDMLISNHLQYQEENTIIIANLPYVCAHHMSMSSLMHEPELALIGHMDFNMQYTNFIQHMNINPSLVSTRDGFDGIDIISCLFIQSSQISHSHTLLLEADPIQFDMIYFLANKYQYTRQATVWDYANKARIFSCRK